MVNEGYAKHHNSESNQAEINCFVSSLQVTISSFQEAHFDQRWVFFSGRLGHKCPKLILLILKVKIIGCYFKLQVPIRKTISLGIGLFKIFGA